MHRPGEFVFCGGPACAAQACRKDTDLVRKHLNPAYRLKEGVLVAQSGIYMDLTTRSHRVEYRPEERTGHPYPGLKQFKKIRESRDFNFGSGEEPHVQPAPWE